MTGGKKKKKKKQNFKISSKDPILMKGAIKTAE